MKIVTVAEHFPSPFKPYHDAQFERFVLDGHDLTICAFGSHSGELNPAVKRHALHRRVTYLPLTLRDLPPAAWRAFRSIVRQPLRAMTRARRAIGAPGRWKQRLLNSVRSLLLPSEPPEICLVHNLRALVHLRFLKEVYPESIVAFYYHGGEIPGVPSPSATEVVDVFAQVDVVFTNTESSKQNAIGRGCMPDKIRISPVGFNLEEFPDPIKRQYREDGCLNVLMAGRVSPEKGMLDGVRAFHEIVREGLSAKLRIVGDGPELGTLQRYISQHGLQSAVQVLGRVAQEGLLAEYRRADVFLLPSVGLGNWEENQACVVQEAMMMRAVAIVSRTGGVPESTAPEMLQFSFAPGDVVGLTESLRRAANLDAQDIERLGEAGRRFVEGRYDIRRLNAELIEAAIQSRASLVSG